MKLTEIDELNPKTVLGIAAHPDDLDFAMAGSIAHWVGEGAEAYYLVLTNGSKGSSDRSTSSSGLIATRRKEQQAAAKILGVKKVFFCDYDDGHLCCEDDVKRDIVRIVRQIKPDVVMTMDPTMVYSLERNFINHPDHRAAGQAALDAVFPLARDHLTFPELLAEGYEPHVTPTVLLVNFEKYNYFVDISQTLDQKMRALAAHSSQVADMAHTQKVMTDYAAQMGEKAGMPYAEAFVRIDVNPL